MFQLTLTEIEDAKRLDLVDGDGKTETLFNGGGTFEHFRHSFRELPQAKIQQIIALITKPPRAPRKDRGRKRKGEGTPELLAT